MCTKYCARYFPWEILHNILYKIYSFCQKRLLITNIDLNNNVIMSLPLLYYDLFYRESIECA